jgi:hypothetical protein
MVFVNLLLLFIGTCIVTIADLCFIDFSVWFFDARTFRRHFNYVLTIATTLLIILDLDP